MTHCSSCEAENIEAAKFCRSCGGALPNLTPEPVFAKHKWVAAAGVASVAIAAGAYWHFSDSQSVYFAPMEAEWQYVDKKIAGGMGGPTTKCNLTKRDGSTVSIHSKKVVGYPIDDPKVLAQIPDSLKMIVGGQTYTVPQFSAYRFTESLGDWIAMEGPQGIFGVISGDTITPFTNDGDVSFVDADGEMQILPIAHTVRATAFSKHGVAGVLFNNGPNSQEKWGIIDRTGAAIIPPRFDNFVMINSDSAFVEQSGKWGRIDIATFAANPVVYNFTFEYDGVAPTPNARLIAVKFAGRWGVVQSYGQTGFEHSYDRILPTFSETYFSAQSAGKWGVYDLNGKVIFAPNFDAPPLLFPEGSAAFALTTVGDTVNWVDMQGKILKSEAIRISGLYTSPTPVIIASEEFKRPNNDPIADEMPTAYRYFLLDDKGRTLSKPSSNKYLQGGNHFTGACIRKPVGDNFG